MMRFLSGIFGKNEKNKYPHVEKTKPASQTTHESPAVDNQTLSSLSSFWKSDISGPSQVSSTDYQTNGASLGKKSRSETQSSQDSWADCEKTLTNRTSLCSKASTVTPKLTPRSINTACLPPDEMSEEFGCIDFTNESNGGEHSQPRIPVTTRLNESPGRNNTWKQTFSWRAESETNRRTALPQIAENRQFDTCSRSSFFEASTYHQPLSKTTSCQPDWNQYLSETPAITDVERRQKSTGGTSYFSVNGRPSTFGRSGLASVETVPVPNETVNNDGEATQPDWLVYTTCGVCREVFNDPRFLSCGHTFCLECLDKIHNAAKNRQISHHTMNCPVCRAGSNLPDGSVRRLPINYSVRDLSERLIASNSSLRSARTSIDVKPVQRKQTTAPIQEKTNYGKFVMSQRQRIKLKIDVAISGLALHRKIIYASFYFSNFLRIIDLKSPKKIREIVVDGLKSPIDVATHDDFDWLFIVDEHRNHNCIWKFDLLHRKLTEWLTGVEDPYLIHISPHTKSLLRLSSNSFNSFLYLYDIEEPKAKIQQKIKLPEVIRHPKHALQTADGNFVISYGTGYQTKPGSWSEWNVSFLSPDGELMRTLASTPLIGPLYYSTLDYKDTVFVSEGSMKTVLRLKDDQVHASADAFSSKNKLDPFRITVSNSNKWLIVGYTTGIIDIFKNT